MIWLIITEWLGLEQSLRWLRSMGREPGTLFRIQRPNAPIWVRTRQDLRCPAGGSTPCSHRALLLWWWGHGRVDVPPQGVGRDPGDLLAPQMSSSQPEWQQWAAGSVPATIPDGAAAAGVQRSHCTWAVSPVSWTFLSGCTCTDDLCTCRTKGLCLGTSKGDHKKVW